MRRPDLLHSRSLNMETVQSSNVHSALYDYESEDFYIRFLRSGPDDIYRYPGRTIHEWVGFQNSNSKGQWVWNRPIGEGWPFVLMTQRDFWTADVDPDDVHPTARDFALRRR